MDYTKENLVEYIQKLDTYNLEIGSSGNISFRLPGGLIAIKPSGLTYGEVTTDNLSIVDENARLISGLRPSSDLVFHKAIFDSYKDINCVIHTHSHFAVVMSMLGKPLEVLTTMHADYFGKSVYCMPYKNHRDADMAKSIIENKERVFIVERHGAIISADDPDTAIKKAVILEEIAALNYHSALINSEIAPLDNATVAKLHEFYNSSYGNKPK